MDGLQETLWKKQKRQRRGETWSGRLLVVKNEERWKAQVCRWQLA